MMAMMTRNVAAGSNTRGPQNPATSPYVEFYEQLYATLGPQEWILLPDAGQSKVVLSFPKGAGFAFLDGTCSPPTVAMGQEVSPLGAYAPVIYPLVDPPVTDTTQVLIEGDSAIRVNVLSGSVGISVRC